MTSKEIKEEIREMAYKIAEQFQPEKIILFGSQAWGEPGEDSDVDLFVIKETDNTRKLAAEIDGSLFPRQIPLDIIVYQPEQFERRLEAGDMFVKDVVENGNVLYERRAA